MSKKTLEPIVPVADLPTLPAKWEWVMINDLGGGVRNAIVDGPFGSNLKISDYVEDGSVPVLTTKNLEGDYTRVRYITAEKLEELQRSAVNGGDILMAKIGSCGKTGIYPSNMPTAMIPANLLKVSLADGFDLKYTYYYFQSRRFQTDLKRIIKATAQPAFGVTSFKRLPFPLPPLSEQRRIVARIEELFSRLDTGVAALRQAKAQLQRYRQSVLAAAVTGQLTQAWREQHPDTEPAEELLKRILEQRREQWNGRGRYKEPVDSNHAPIFKIPESWKWTSLDQLMLNITDGDHQAPPQTDNGIPFLVIGNIRSGSISFDGSRFVRVDYFQSLDCFRTPSSGDILYSLVGSFGIAVLVKTAEPFCVQRHIGILRPHASSPAAYLSYALNSRFVYDQASEVSTGTAQKTVPLSGLRKIAIPLPPLAEQNQIVAEVETRTTAIDHLEAELDRQITRSNRLRKAALGLAFSGSL